jgi:hypothetical protein
MFLIGLYGDTALLPYGGRDNLRVSLLCEMQTCPCIIFYSLLILMGHAVAHLVKALHYKLHYDTGVDQNSNRNEYRKCIMGVKAVGV